MIKMFFSPLFVLLGTLRPLFAKLLVSTIKSQFHPNLYGALTSALIKFFLLRKIFVKGISNYEN